MFTKTLLVTLILASASFALTSRGIAGPKHEAATAAAAESNWIDRASKTYDFPGGN
jgi:hypothetical protein